MDIVHIVLFEFCEPRQIVPLYLADVGQVLRGWTWGLGSVSTGSVGLQSLNLEFETKGSLFKGRNFPKNIIFPTFRPQSEKGEFKNYTSILSQTKKKLLLFIVGGRGFR